MLFRSDSSEQAARRFRDIAHVPEIPPPIELVQRDFWPNPCAKCTRPSVPIAAVQAAFDSCLNLRDAATELDVSVQVLGSWLRNWPLLARAWRRRIRSQRTRSALSRVYAVIAKNQCATLKALDVLCGTDIRWLRDHAPTYLDRVLVVAKLSIDCQGGFDFTFDSSAHSVCSTPETSF